MLSGYEDEVVFIECEFRVSLPVGHRKVPVTYDMRRFVLMGCTISYQ